MTFARMFVFLALLGFPGAIQVPVFAQNPGSSSKTTVLPVYWEDFAERGELRPSPDLGQACTGPGKTPLCAFKTWVTCILYDLPNLCAAVGAPAVTMRSPDPSVLDAGLLAEPWALSLDEIMHEAFAFTLYDGGIVPRDRFAVTLYGAQQPEPGYREKFDKVRNGDIDELVADFLPLDGRGDSYQISFFFRKSGEDWQLAGWHSNRNGVCTVPLAPPGWQPCSYHVPHLALRDTLSGKHTLPPLWKSPTGADGDKYRHMGVDLRAKVGEPAVAVMDGRILRRLPVYLDTPVYDWVVLDADTLGESLIIKYAYVDRSGPGVGTTINAGTPLGLVQDPTIERPGTDDMIHFETVLEGVHIDPMTILPKRSP